ncbi:MAG TPA: hypothetical protein VFI18_12135 [Gaiellales bacterium]|nr:hypothetical protein [Gaiellales bacterium]
MEERQIEVTALEVRRALARTFHGAESPEHAWEGSVGVGDAVVGVDVVPREGGALVHARARSIECTAEPGRLARVLASENAELVLGRFAAKDGAVDVEHAILAGTTMDAVEVQASVWAVGWAAASFAPRLRALVTDAVPVPRPPQTPAARLRDAADHVEFTTRRVRQHLDARHGGFEHHPDWGFHGAFGSARVFVEVLPVLDDSTAVRVSSPVLSQVTISDELALRLLALAGEQPFGAFAHVAARDEVWLQHAILGDDLDPVELATAIDAVAAIADGCDDDLAREFGGLRYADLG